MGDETLRCLVADRPVIADRHNERPDTEGMEGAESVVHLVNPHDRSPGPYLRAQ
jgi:hypothetical protein